MAEIGGIGVTPVEENLPPLVLRNYGKWDTHEIFRPGVIKRISVGGKASNTGSGPDLGRLVIPYLPNNPPRWEDAVSAVVRIMDAWEKDAYEDERIREWINRIGWDRFFKNTGIPVSSKHVDGYIFGNEFAGSDLRFGW